MTDNTCRVRGCCKPIPENRVLCLEHYNTLPPCMKKKVKWNPYTQDLEDALKIILEKHTGVKIINPSNRYRRTP